MSQNSMLRRQELIDKIEQTEVFQSSVLEKSQIDAIKEQYEVKCSEVFKDLQSDKEFARNLETGGIFKFNKYEIGSIADYDQASATQAALDFITGLKQFRDGPRVQCNVGDDIIEALTNEMDTKMSLEDPKPPQTEVAEDLSTFRPKFIKKADRQAKARVDVEMKQNMQNLKTIKLDYEEEVDIGGSSSSKVGEDSEMKSVPKSGFMQRKKVEKKRNALD